jgi:hypothetical protein
MRFMSATTHPFTHHAEVMKVEGSGVTLRDGTAEADPTLARLAAYGERTTLAEAEIALKIKVEDAEADSADIKLEPETYYRWVAEGKPLCPNCARRHAPPCDPVMGKRAKTLDAMKEMFPEQYEQHQREQAAKKKAARKGRRKQNAALRKSHPDPDSDANNGTLSLSARARSHRLGAARGDRWCKNCGCSHPEGQHWQPLNSENARPEGYWNTQRKPSTGDL